MTAIPYVWHLSKSFTYFIFNLLFRCICIWVSLRGASNKGVQRHGKRILWLQNDDTLHQGVCSSPEKHQLFNDIINDSSRSGIEIKRFRSGDNNNDIIVHDFSSANEIELNFERKTSQSKPFTFEQVINEYAIYDIVDVTGLVYNL